LEIGKKDLKTNVLNINIRKTRSFVVYNLIFYIRNFKWDEENCTPDMLKNIYSQAKNLDEIIPSLCAERGRVCGSKMNFGTAMKGKGTQVS
jgi:hypothetical protein